MAAGWAFGRAFNYEKLQILNACFQNSPDIPTHYYLHISTTQPNPDATGITEYSGNGYAPVLIPTWTGGSGGVVNDPDEPAAVDGTRAVGLNGMAPSAPVVFPNPSARWWADGTIVYPYLTDSAGGGGHPRWWFRRRPITGPTPGFPLSFAALDPVDGTPDLVIAAGGRFYNPNPSPGVFHDPTLGLNGFLATALEVLTKINTTYVVPPLYVGWHGGWWSTAVHALTDYYHGVDIDPGPNQFRTDEGQTGDPGYSRLAVSFGAATLVSGQAQCSNTADLIWTTGGDASFFGGALDWGQSTLIIWNDPTAVDTFPLHPHILMILGGENDNVVWNPFFPGTPQIGDTIKIPMGSIVFALD